MARRCLRQTTVPQLPPQQPQNRIHIGTWLLGSCRLTLLCGGRGKDRTEELLLTGHYLLHYLLHYTHTQNTPAAPVELQPEVS